MIARLLITVMLAAVMGCTNVYASEVLPTEAPPTEETQSATQPEEEWVSLGKWKITHYCACHTCSGQWGHQTSSGARCTEGVTAACAILPPGTEVMIEGYGKRIVQDTGSGVRGHHLDVFYESHRLCNDLGIKYREVFVKKK